jgi:hypothetical protein
MCNPTRAALTVLMLALLAVIATSEPSRDSTHGDGTGMDHQPDNHIEPHQGPDLVTDQNTAKDDLREDDIEAQEVEQDNTSKSSQVMPLARRSSEPPRVSSVCVYNKAALVLKWKLKGPVSSSRHTRAYPVFQNKCIHANAVPGITNGTVLYPEVKAAWGRRKTASQPVIFDPNVANQVTYICRGTTLNFSCKQGPVPPSSADIAKNIGDFLNGFTEGLGTEIGINACTRDAVATGHVIETMVDFFESGINGKILTTIRLGFEMIIQLVQRIASSIQTCVQGVGPIVAKLTALAARLAGNVMEWISVVIEGVIKIIRQGREITENIKGIVTEWRAGDFKGSGEDAGTVVGIFLNTIQDL